MIVGVKVKELKFYLDDRGRLLEILRADDKLFKKFGQVYITTIYPGIIKAWHLHKKQTDNLCCIKGNVKLVLYDNRKNSRSFSQIMEFAMGEARPMIVQVPPGVYHGIKCIGNEEAIVLNVPDYPYNHKKPDEYRLDPYSKEIAYDWSRVNR
ncbi:MAG TPA: dTDP-4-dehydrorhamnose 3,5-epimerase [Candidatus Omnitrophica bacterium]|nr:dTDP-4-dehydrorhamnose 3,5-epimerase [Candidatus Omnitrophota bacterium]